MSAAATREPRTRRLLGACESTVGRARAQSLVLAHSRLVGEHKRSVDDLDRAMGLILAAVADGHVSVEQARRLIRAKGVVPAAKQIRKATRDLRRHESIAGRDSKRPEPIRQGPSRAKRT